MRQADDGSFSGDLDCENMEVRGALVVAGSPVGAVVHDATLTGAGTGPSPLGVANLGVGTAQLANLGVTTGKIADNAVTLTKLLQLASGSFLARVSGAIGNAEIINGTQATSLLDVFTTLLKGLVPASGGGTANFLRADGAWQAPPGAVTLPIAESDVTNLVADLAAKALKTTTISTTAPITGGGDLSANRTLAVNTFDSTHSGIVPLSGGGTANFLRADGSWSAPPAPALYGDPGWYGNASDGSVTFDGAATVLGLAPSANVYTLVRDIFCNALTINVGVQVKCDGYRVFATTLTCNGTLHDNGTNATNVLSGRGASSNYMGGGSNGGAAQTAGQNNSVGAVGLMTADSASVVQSGGVGLTPTVPCRGGGGGGDNGTIAARGNSPGAASGTIVLTSSALGSADIWAIFQGSTATNPASTQWKAGTGGGGGSQHATAGSTATGGSAGGGGGFLFVVAKTLTGTGTISSNGSIGWPASVTGVDASAGGGGGGGGGIVVVVYGTRTGSLTIQASGGAGVAGAQVGAGNTGFAGGAGSNGIVILSNTSGDGT